MVKFFMVSDVVYALQCKRCERQKSDYFIYCHGCDTVACIDCLYSNQHPSRCMVESAKTVVGSMSIVERVVP